VLKFSEQFDKYNAIERSIEIYVKNINFATASKRNICFISTIPALNSVDVPLSNTKNTTYSQKLNWLEGNEDDLWLIENNET